jgi:hypothetical protein
MAGSCLEMFSKPMPLKYHLNVMDVLLIYIKLASYQKQKNSTPV